MKKDKVHEIEERIAARLDENGHEIPDPTPLGIPSGFKRPETLAAQVQRLVQGSLSRHAELQGNESWEEANDFNVDDEFDPTTPFEEFFDPVIGRSVTPLEFEQNKDRYREEVLIRQRNYYRQLEQEELERFAERGVRGDSPSPAAAKPPPAEPQESS